MSKDKDKAKKEQQKKDQQKKDKKSPPKQSTLKGKLFKLIALIALVSLAGGVGHFYTKNKRFPKSGKDFTTIAKNVLTFYQAAGNTLQEEWKKLDLQGKGEKLAKGFEDLLGPKKGKGTKTSGNTGGSGGGGEAPAANVKPDPARPHIQSSQVHFEKGRSSLKTFRSSRNQSALKDAKTAFEKSREELEAAKSKSSDDDQKNLIEAQLQRVNQYISDCGKMGTFGN